MAEASTARDAKGDAAVNHIEDNFFDGIDDTGANLRDDDGEGEERGKNDEREDSSPKSLRTIMCPIRMLRYRV
jgi:hypothetical protein